MDRTSELISRTQALQRRANHALHSGDYPLAETLYKEGIELLIGVMDPVHTAYVALLKGLLTSLSKQSKAGEATKVRETIAQLCIGQ